MLSIKKSKKAMMHTWFDYTIAIVGGIIIFVILYFIASSGTAKVEKEIKAHTADIRSEETLVSYLSSPVSKDFIFRDMLGQDAYKMAGELADSKMTFADLITMIGERDIALNKKILQIETEYILNSTLGKDNWQLDITYPDSSISLSYGKVKGENRISELKLPSTGYQVINVKFTAKKEG